MTFINRLLDGNNAWTELLYDGSKWARLLDSNPKWIYHGIMGPFIKIPDYWDMPDINFNPGTLRDLPSDELTIIPGGGCFLKYHIQSAQLEEGHPDKKPEICLLRYLLNIAEKALEKPAFYTSKKIAQRWLKQEYSFYESGDHWASRLKNRCLDLGILLGMPCPKDAKFVMHRYRDLYFPKRTFLPRDVLTHDKICRVRTKDIWERVEKADGAWRPLNEIAQNSIDFIISAGPEVDVTEVLDYIRDQYQQRTDAIELQR